MNSQSLLTFAFFMVAGSSSLLAAEIRRYGEDVFALLSGPEQMTVLGFREDWTGCSDPVKEAVKITSVTLSGRYLISSFETHSEKWGAQLYHIDLSSLPNSDQWLPTTLIKRGATVEVTSRRCGSVPVLQSVESPITSDFGKGISTRGSDGECYITGNMAGYDIYQYEEFRPSPNDPGIGSHRVAIAGENSRASLGENCTQVGKYSLSCISIGKGAVIIASWSVYPDAKKVIYMEASGEGHGGFNGGSMFVGDISGRCD